jgi:cell division protein FtsX
MRRAAAAACLLAAVVTGGCGGQKRAREVPARLAAPRSCHVTVFFTTRMVTGREATRSEIASLREKLASSSRIKSYAFVSKRLALRRMSKRHPELMHGIVSNPLPAAYEIVPRSVGEAKKLAAELRRARGVEHVSAARSC